MKKTILVLFVTVLSVATVSAQGLNLGVRAGFNASNITGFPKIDLGDLAKASNNYKPGFQVGVVAQYMTTASFGFETGLYYSMLGTDYKVTAGSVVSEKITMNPSYLQLPITALYKFNVGTDLDLYPQAGVYLGYGLGGKIKDGNESVNFFGKINDEEEEIANRFDAGLTLGLNLQYSKFVIGLGYDLGLLKINKEALGEGFNDLNNRNIKVTLGYFF
ncbi:MAG: PorT family protein [Dysgonamonadaceae bacterium]|jgi:hypothetical protein|nr:PorT family protein [Dysgonamonadaceae bacterium]